ncbi:MAG TPA: AMP-binding protein, partial [Pseudonocardia sp.]|nr:AMP-binding protein [Pseudonocardia sp.]
LGPVSGPVLAPGPLSSSLFLFGALHGLWCGQQVLVRPRSHAAHARRARTVHLVPAMLADLLDDLERSAGPCGLRTVVCGGAATGAALRDRFARLLPETTLVDYYGSAEHSLIAVRRGAGDQLAVPGVDLEVRDGVLWVRSPLAFAGYLRAGAVEPAAGWTTVGDLVALAPDGALTVHGRGSATISSGGRLVSAEEVETVLRAVPGVDDVLVTGTPHGRLGELVTAVVEAAAPPALRELRAAARAALEPAKRPRRWLTTSALPRTPSGKPARAGVAEQLAAGTFPAEPLS